MAAQQATRETVLYVEDEECDAFFMRLAFQKAGMELAFHVVADGREAIEYLAGDNGYADRGRYPLPAVILLDLNLPLISGFEVLAWLRERPEFRTLPVVVFSSSSRAEDKKKALALGANEYLEKPNSALLFGPVVEQLKQHWLAAPRAAG